MIVFCAIGMLEVEHDAPGSKIKTAEDALWWAYVTITTVGYGDVVPVTREGRMIAAVLMTVGVGLFGTFTAYVASWFVEKKEEERQEEQNLEIHEMLQENKNNLPSKVDASVMNREPVAEKSD
jgi:voltage-gated potassium channel